MTNTAKKTTKVAPSVKAQTLTFVPNKARAEHNVLRAKAVNGMSYEQALEHYKTLGYKERALKYDISKIKSLKIG
jgi:hypothetical protein